MPTAAVPAAVGYPAAAGYPPMGYGAPTTPPPGWYPDPQGGPGRRYWDGARWTEHTG